MILLSNMTQFDQMTELWIFVACPNRVEPPKQVSYLKLKANVNSTDNPNTNPNYLAQLVFTITCLLRSHVEWFKLHNAYATRERSCELWLPKAGLRWLRYACLWEYLSKTILKNKFQILDVSKSRKLTAFIWSGFWASKCYCMSQNSLRREFFVLILRSWNSTKYVVSIAESRYV